MPERVRKDDPYRDSTAQPEPQPGQGTDPYVQDADVVFDTDPTAAQPSTFTFNVPASGATSALAATNAIVLADDNLTVTSVTYTPAGAITPGAGNGRTWTLTGTEGTIATLTVTNPATLASGAPAAFTINHAAVAEETLQIASTVAGGGVADPGGVLTVTVTF